MKKDLKTETKHQRWSSWISTSGVVSTAATAAARVRAWSSAFAAPRIVRQCYCSIFIPFYSFYIQNLWIFGRLYMALLRSRCSNCLETVPRKWMRAVFMSEDFSKTFFRWKNEDPVRSAFQSWRRLAKVLEVEALFLSNSPSMWSKFPQSFLTVKFALAFS